MKIAVFADIHGNKQALEAIISDIKKRNIDNVICLGDTIALGPSSKECLDLIIENKIPMLLGNHELYHMYGHDIDNSFTDAKSKHHNWLNSVLKDDYKQFLLDCDYVYNKLLDIIDNLDSDITIVGHEHTRKIVEHNDKKIIVLGSSGCVTDDNTLYTIISDDTGEITVEKIDIKYDREKFEEVFNESEDPEKELYNTMFFGVKLKKM